MGLIRIVIFSLFSNWEFDDPCSGFNDERRTNRNLQDSHADLTNDLLLQLQGPMLSEDCDETLYHTGGTPPCGAHRSAADPVNKRLRLPNCCNCVRACFVRLD